EIYHGRVFYAKDAFEGLRLMGELCGGDEPAVQYSSPSDTEENEPKKRRASSHRLPDRDPGLYVFDGVKSAVATDIEVPELPFYGAKRRTQFDINEIYKYVNPVALWRGQWQYKKPEGMGNPEF